MGPAPEVSLFAHSARIIRQTVEVNIEGISHPESLIAPRPAGSCANWILGHLAHSYEQTLPHLGQPKVVDNGTLERYRRGSDPIGEGSPACDFDELRRIFAESSDRIGAGLASLNDEALATTSNYFGGKSETTLAKFLNFIFFHQAYHAGQLGVLRRIVGKEGAIP
ncbi:MAG TPA: DinB family protein [Trueperaceae bacterium]